MRRCALWLVCVCCTCTSCGMRIAKMHPIGDAGRQCPRCHPFLSPWLPRWAPLTGHPTRECLVDAGELKTECCGNCAGGRGGVGHALVPPPLNSVVTPTQTNCHAGNG